MKNSAYDPGKMDQIIQVLREVKTPDGYGGNEVERVTFVENLRAEIVPGAPREPTNYDQVHNTEVVTFRVRFRTDILETDIIEWEGVEFNIRAIPSMSRRSYYLDIVAERGVGA